MTPHQNPETGAADVDLLHDAIRQLRQHVSTIQSAKAAVLAGEVRPGYNPLLDCINALPQIVRQLEMAELEIEAAFERYEELAPSIQGGEAGGGDVIALVDPARWDHPGAPQMAYANGWNDALYAHPKAPELDRESVARAVAGAILEQDGYSADGSYLNADLTIDYLDQGVVDFGKVADAIIALASKQDASHDR